MSPRKSFALTGVAAAAGWLANTGYRLKVMKGAISKNASYFNSHRMMRRYATEAYLR